MLWFLRGPIRIEKVLETAPRKNSENEAIKCITFLCKEEPIVISFTEQFRDVGLAVHYLGHSKFIAVSFQEKKSEKDELEAKNDISNVIKDIITRGISYNSTEYHFFGHSNSQLKTRSCYFYNANAHKIEQIIANIGDFPEPVAKKAKYIGLLFTGVRKFVDISSLSFSTINDITKGDFKFTDGCGSISKEAAFEISKSMSLRTVPSVFQIRYKVINKLLNWLNRDSKEFLRLMESWKEKKFNSENQWKKF